jgi:hypothetical protein
LLAEASIRTILGEPQLMRGVQIEAAFATTMLVLYDMSQEFYPTDRDVTEWLARAELAADAIDDGHVPTLTEAVANGWITYG